MLWLRSLCTYLSAMLQASKRLQDVLTGLMTQDHQALTFRSFNRGWLNDHLAYQAALLPLPPTAQQHPGTISRQPPAISARATAAAAAKAERTPRPSADRSTNIPAAQAVQKPQVVLPQGDLQPLQQQQQPPVQCWQRWQEGNSGPRSRLHVAQAASEATGSMVVSNGHNQAYACPAMHWYTAHGSAGAGG